jgi:hypothetical protein
MGEGMIRISIEHWRDFVVDVALNLGSIEIVDLQVVERHLSHHVRADFSRSGLTMMSTFTVMKKPAARSERNWDRKMKLVHRDKNIQNLRLVESPSLLFPFLPFLP